MGQRAADLGGELPWLLFGALALVLFSRLLRAVLLQGPFTEVVAHRLSVLGWFVTAGTPLAGLIVGWSQPTARSQTSTSRRATAPAGCASAVTSRSCGRWTAGAGGCSSTGATGATSGPSSTLRTAQHDLLRWYALRRVRGSRPRGEGASRHRGQELSGGGLGGTVEDGAYVTGLDDGSVPRHH